MSSTSTSSGGIGFAGILTVLFIALKLTGYISWSWLWVLSPMWIPAALVIALFLCGFAVVLFDDRKRKRRINGN